MSRYNIIEEIKGVKHVVDTFSTLSEAVDTACLLSDEMDNYNEDYLTIDGYDNGVTKLYVEQVMTDGEEITID